MDDCVDQILVHFACRGSILVKSRSRLLVTFLASCSLQRAFFFKVQLHSAIQPNTSIALTGTMSTPSCIRLAIEACKPNRVYLSIPHICSPKLTSPDLFLPPSSLERSATILIHYRRSSRLSIVRLSHTRVFYTTYSPART